MSTTIPMRYNIIKQLVHNEDGLTPIEIYKIIASSYPNEKQCSEKEIDAQLMSLKGTGLVEIIDTIERSDGILESTYLITTYGKERAQKYIGKLL